MTAVVGPRRAVPFLNRLGPRGQLDSLLARRREQGRPLLVFVHGPEGIGRFSLVTEFYHDHRASFDHLCIEVDARRLDGTLVPKGEMLGQALGRLGLAESDLPASDRARAEAFGRLAAGRRFLLVLKDVMNAEQVTGFIPDGAPEAALVVTTRVMLRQLLVHDFDEVALTKLARNDTRELLVRRLGATADKIEPGRLDELADLCDGLPWLVRLLAAQLVGRAHAASRFIEELRDPGADPTGGDLSRRITCSLDLAYVHLERGQQVAYRALARIPGPDFPSATAAVVLEVPRGPVEAMLDSLVDAHLLTYQERTARYAFHRIIRADAQRRARQVDGPAAWRAGVSRVTRWLLDEAARRTRGVSGRWLVGPAFEAGDGVPVDRAAALAWFADEWRTLVEAVALAHAEGLSGVAWQTCVAVYKYLHIHGHYDAWLESHRIGVLAARQDGQPAGVMQVRSQRGAAYLELGEWDAAEEDFRASLDAAGELRHALGEQSAWEWLGKVAAARGDADTALAHFGRSEAVIVRRYQAIGARQAARMRATLGLQRARTLLVRSEWQHAAHTARAAAAHFAASGEWENQAKCLIVVGKAATETADPTGASQTFEHAAALFARDNARRPRAEALDCLAEALVALGRTTEAIAAYRSAGEVLHGLGDPRADAVADKIEGLSGPGSP